MSELEANDQGGLVKVNDLTIEKNQNSSECDHMSILGYDKIKYDECSTSPLEISLLENPPLGSPPLESPPLESTPLENPPLESPPGQINFDDNVVVGNKDNRSVLDSKIGLVNLPEQRQSHVQKLRGRFNLLVAGQTGVGKTTFINTLFNENLLKVKEGPYGPSGLSITKFNLTEQKFSLKLNIIETSGLGQFINNEGCWIPISNFIDKQFQLHLFQEQQPDRTLKVDHRIHCCIYILSPHSKQLSPLDLTIIKELASKVNVIPVIGKSDCLNVEEMETLKMGLKNHFNNSQVKFCDFITDEELHMKINENLPFSIIGSNETLVKGGVAVRVRKYPWGIIDVSDSNYCQFSLLSRILISDNMLDFILSTENHYEQFRGAFLDRFITDTETGSGAQTTGLHELLIYSQMKYSQFKAINKNSDDVLKYKENLLKDKFSEEINNQEKRFKEWKRKLVEKQNELNDDIEIYHKELIELQETIFALEEGFGLDHTTLNTLSKKTDSLDKEITNGRREMRLLSFPFN